MTTFYDSVTAGNIPSSAQDAAGYVGGFYLSWLPLSQRVPPFACLLKIAVSASLDGDALDVEKGDATPAQAPAWVQRQSPRPGWKPMVYMDVSSWLSVRQAFLSASQPEPWYWVAGYPSPVPTSPVIPEPWLMLGAVLWQYADMGPYDLSISSPSFPPLTVTEFGFLNRRKYRG